MLTEEKTAQMRLTDFKVLSFDCYGTLIDWERGMGEALKPLLARTDRILTRDQALEAHARHEAALEAEMPGVRYADLLVLVHDRMAREWGVDPIPEESRAYGRSIKDWPAFVDSAAALQYLKKYYKLAILSNIDRESFKASQSRLQAEWDYVFTAEDIGSYKPDPRNFEYMLRELAKDGIRKQDILHTAESLFHDLVPASRIGLASAWIHRRAGKKGTGATFPPDHMPPYDFRFTSLAKMAKAHQDFLRTV
jgi:2-haloalkanoic acid dehalogenase type II